MRLGFCLLRADKAQSPEQDADYQLEQRIQRTQHGSKAPTFLMVTESEKFSVFQDTILERSRVRQTANGPKKSKQSKGAHLSWNRL